MKIRKTKGTAILNGNVVDSLEENSTTNAPSQRAVNEKKIGETKSKKEVLWFGSGQGYRAVDNPVQGNNQPHNNMPPYLVVYMWKRTA